MSTTKADMIKPSNGLVISYNYLWAREHNDREVLGRKARPACVQIIIQDDKRGTVVALFPITSQPPHATRTALEIPEIDARRIGLKFPSWIMVDEWNLDDLAKSPHIAHSYPASVQTEAAVEEVRCARKGSLRIASMRRDVQVLDRTRRPDGTIRSDCWA